MSEQCQRCSRAVTEPTQNGSLGNKQIDLETEIDLIELLYYLLAHWKLLLCCMLVFSIAAGCITTFLITPQYKATSVMYVLGNSESAINLSDLQIGNALTQDYVKVFKMWEVKEQVIQNLKLPYSYAKLQSMLSVSNDSNTRMIDITITSPNPQEAADIANEYAIVVSQYIAETMSTDKPNIMSVALPPANPSSPSMAKNLMLGMMLGFAVSAGCLVIRFLLDDKYKSSEDIYKYTGLTTLAVILREPTAEKTGGTEA